MKLTIKKNLARSKKNRENGRQSEDGVYYKEVVPGKRKAIYPHDKSSLSLPDISECSSLMALLTESIKNNEISQR